MKAALHRQFFKGTIKQIPEVMVKKIGKKIKKHSEKIKQLQEGLKIEKK